MTSKKSGEITTLQNKDISSKKRAVFDSATPI